MDRNWFSELAGHQLWQHVLHHDQELHRRRMAERVEQANSNRPVSMMVGMPDRRRRVQVYKHAKPKHAGAFGPQRQNNDQAWRAAQGKIGSWFNKFVAEPSDRTFVAMALGLEDDFEGTLADGVQKSRHTPAINRSSPDMLRQLERIAHD